MGVAKEIFPSSYVCDCGSESHFFENTIREMKQMSKRKRVALCGDHNHTIIFKGGKAVEIRCPKGEAFPILEVEY
jgi:2-polyprenyl-6-methoxyphenol hydroxylase-like FAD-dependent oxidoreductase